MDRDDIIKMAREAGFTNPERLEIFGIKDENLRGILEDFWINLERFAALVAAEEREACAKVCEERQEVFQKYYTKGLAAMCAEAIRARSKQ